MLLPDNLRAHYFTARQEERRALHSGKATFPYWLVRLVLFHSGVVSTAQWTQDEAESQFLEGDYSRRHYSFIHGTHPS